MSDANRVQERRKRLRDAGKAPVTVWLSREEKRRLEALAKTWHCSTSELVQQALGAFHPASPPVTVAITDTEQLRQFITATVTEIVTAMLPELVRETVEGMAREQATTNPAMPGTALGYAYTGDESGADRGRAPGRERANALWGGDTPGLFFPGVYGEEMACGVSFRKPRRRESNGEAP